MLNKEIFEVQSVACDSRHTSAMQMNRQTPT
jgi:hypothetical protein